MSLAIAYKNFSLGGKLIVRPIGLGISAVNTVKVLRAAGIDAHVWPTSNIADLEYLVNERPNIDHIIINAPWIPTYELSVLCNKHPHRNFYVNVHSNVGFLQADRNGVKLIREYMELEKGIYNFHLAANSAKFVDWLRKTFCAPCLYLPNLYYLTKDDAPSRPGWQREGVLKIGSFGAIRPLKNQITAAAAALTLSTVLRTPVEFHMSTDRMEGGGDVTFGAILAMYDALPNAKVVQDPWQSWPQFRNLVREMHLLIHCSHTESFSMVTADGIAEGVPSVVSDAICWVPEYWKANLDDVMDIVQVGRHLLTDPHSSEDGTKALRHYNDIGTQQWANMNNSGVDPDHEATPEYQPK